MNTDDKLDAPIPSDAGTYGYMGIKRDMPPPTAITSDPRSYIHTDNGRGIAPLRTVMAAKFPLLSRRQRRAMQRAISKQADKERG